LCVVDEHLIEIRALGPEVVPNKDVVEHLLDEVVHKKAEA